MFIPRPLQELRVEKQFKPVEEVTAAMGVKVAAQNLEEVIPGSPIIVVEDENRIEEAKGLVMKEIEGVEFKKDISGVIVKADTIGGLEALITLLEKNKIPVRKAEIGSVKKEDIMELKNLKERERRVILVFNVKVSEDMKNLAKDYGVKIFENNIIYKVVEDYLEWCKKLKEIEIQEKLEKVSRPVEIRVLQGCVFRSSSPCIVGVEVLEGFLKPGVSLVRRDGKFVGKVKEIQSQGERVENALPGEKVAISMDEPVAGRTFKEGDVLISLLTREDLKILEELKDKITESERRLLEKFRADFSKFTQ